MPSLSRPDTHQRDTGLRSNNATVTQLKTSHFKLLREDLLGKWLHLQCVAWWAANTIMVVSLHLQPGLFYKVIELSEKLNRNTGLLVHSGACFSQGNKMCLASRNWHVVTEYSNGKPLAQPPSLTSTKNDYITFFFLKTDLRGMRVSWKPLKTEPAGARAAKWRQQHAAAKTAFNDEFTYTSASRREMIQWSPDRQAHSLELQA